MGLRQGQGEAVVGLVAALPCSPAFSLGEGGCHHFSQEQKALSLSQYLRGRWSPWPWLVCAPCPTCHLSAAFSAQTHQWRSGGFLLSLIYHAENVHRNTPAARAGEKSYRELPCLPSTGTWGSPLPATGTREAEEF